jgi:hypothetical protein
LDSHPNIACPPESKFILPLQEVLESPQAIQGLNSMGFTRATVVSRLRTFVASFFEDYAVVKGKSRWADKTPNYLDCLPFLEELFERTAQYVVIVRHPFDVCLSFEHAWQKSGRAMRALESHVNEAGDFRVGACRFWSDQNLKIASFVPQVASRVVSLDYESLTNYPELVLKKVFAFLQEPWEPIVLEYNRVPHDFGFEDRKILQMPKIVPNSGKFLSWPEEERRYLGAEAHEAMEVLGYTPNQAARGRAAKELEKTFVDLDR